MGRANIMSTKTAGNRKPTILDDDLIEEICGYLKRGATDVGICRIVGISPNTLMRWKRDGQDENSNPIFQKFYAEYEKNKGYRELDWIERTGDPKWLLTHHPDTKNAFAEIRYQKDEYSGTLSKLEASERQKAIERDIVNGFDTISQQLTISTSGEAEAEIPDESDETEWAGSLEPLHPSNANPSAEWILE